jgi:CRISPR/Cas system endoribonuclease Cas6 (RAMP superfamily)
MSTKRERDGKLVAHYCLPEDPEFSELVRQNLIRKHQII